MKKKKQKKTLAAQLVCMVMSAMILASMAAGIPNLPCRDAGLVSISPLDDLPRDPIEAQ
jgi:hypothetical protein